MKIQKTINPFIIIGLMLFITNSSSGQNLEDFHTVTSTGLVTTDYTNLESTRQKAIDKALQSVVESTVGVTITSESIIENNTLVKDSIYSKANGYIKSYKIISEGDKHGEYQVKIEAVVKYGEIYSELEKLGLIILSDKVGNPRVMVIVEGSIDEKKQSINQAQTEIMKQLIDTGFEVVEEESVNELKQSFSLERLLLGTLPKAISASNTDIIIVGKVDCSQVKNEIVEASGTFSYTADIEAKAINVSTGKVLYAMSTNKSVIGITKKAAARAANKQAGKYLIKELMPKMVKVMKDNQTIRVLVKGFNKIDDLNSFKNELKMTNGIKKVYTRFVAAGSTKVDIKLADLTQDQLIKVIQKIRTGKYTILNSSKDRIEVQFLPRNLVNQRFILTEFTNRTKSKRLDWLSNTIPEVFEAAMQNSKFCDIVVPFDKQFRNQKGFSPDFIKSLYIKYGATLAGIGKITKNKDRDYRLFIRVYNTKDATVVASMSIYTSIANITDSVQELAFNLDKRIFEEVSGEQYLADYVPPLNIKQKLESELSLDTKEEPNLSETRRRSAPRKKPGPALLQIDDVKLENLYPGKYHYYSSENMGMLALTNTGGDKASNVRISVYIPRFQQVPQVIRVKDIGPGQSTKNPLKSTFEPAKLLAANENIPLQVQFRISYHDGKTKQLDDFTESIILFDRNAMNWAEPELIGSFVTARDDFIKSFTRETSQIMTEKDTPKILSLPVAIFTALSNYKIKYFKDPENPFSKTSLDYVQYPIETITLKSGDCDDMSVLLSAAYESAGIETQFITTPEHIFLSFNTGLSKNQAISLTVKDSMYFIDTNEVWIPIESTKLTKSFEAAWEEGAKEFNRYKGTKELEFIKTRTAWNKYPSVLLQKQDKAISSPSKQSILKKYKQTLGKLNEQELKYQKALFKQYKAKAKKDPQYLIKLAVLYGKLKQYKKSDKLLNNILIKQPKSIKAINNVANIILLQGKHDSAINKYTKALNIAPDSAMILYNLGVANFLKGDDETASKWMKKCLENDGKQVLADGGFLRKIKQNDMRASDTDDRSTKVYQRDLQKLLKQAMEKTNKADSSKEYKKDISLGGRRGADPEELKELSDILIWMD